MQLTTTSYGNLEKPDMRELPENLREVVSDFCAAYEKIKNENSSDKRFMRMAYKIEGDAQKLGVPVQLLTFLVYTKSIEWIDWLYKKMAERKAEDWLKGRL